MAQCLDFLGDVEVISNICDIGFDEDPNVKTDNEALRRERKKRSIAVALLLMFHATAEQAQKLRAIANSPVVRLQTRPNGFADRAKRLCKASNDSAEWMLCDEVLANLGVYEKLKNVRTSGILLAGLLLDKMDN